jgi:hypothetical protein
MFFVPTVRETNTSRTINSPRNSILLPFILTTAVKVNVILIFDTNQSFTKNVVSTLAAKSFNILEIVPPRPQAPRRQFFSEYDKELFHGFDIQISNCFCIAAIKVVDF